MPSPVGSMALPEVAEEQQDLRSPLRSPALTVPRNSFATSRDSTEHDHRSECGDRGKQHCANLSTSTNFQSTSSMTLLDEDLSGDEKDKRQLSESSSTLAVPITLPVKSAIMKEMDHGLLTPPPFETRNTSASLPMFQPHPAVRPRHNSVWAMKSSEQIPLGTEVELTPPGTPLPPSKTSGMGKWHEWIFVFNVCLAQIFSLAGLAQSFAPLLIIADSLGVVDPGQMSWYTAAYSMTLGTFILPAGRLGDMYGHKKIFIVGWIWFSLASLITGFSYVGGPIMLATCRGLQGIGPALLVPNGIALIGRTFPIGMKRAFSIAIFGGCGPVGVTIGVVFSSIFAQLVWWPWCFWVMSIACAGCCVLTYIVIPSDTFRASPVDPDNKTREQFDLLGAFTGVTGLLLINFALNEAPCEGWDHIYIPVLLGVGFLLIGAFVWIELCVASRPIVPLKGLHRDAAFTLACIAAGWASHGIWSYYLYLFIERIRGHPPLVAAAQTWPVALVGFCAALAVPFILRKIKVPYLMSISMLFFFAGTVLLVFAPVNQTYWVNTFLSILIMPFAMNWSFPSGTILMANAVAKQHQGIAASLICTMVNYSIATGLGIAGTLDRYLTPIHGIHGGYRDAWWFGIALSLFGFLISLYFIWQTRSRKPMVAK